MRLEVVRRVAGSPTFKDSKRLQELFLFLCERALNDPAAVIREQEVGVKVFGRPSDYNTTEDTLVRVHASRLRRKLLLYFSTEGRDESVVIEIPKGGYTPVFHFRGSQVADPGVPDPAERRSGFYVRPIWAVLVILAVSTGAAFMALAFTRVSPPAPLAAGSEPRPTVDRLWNQMFGNGRQTCLVLSDSTLTMFEDLLHREIDLNDYKKKQFADLADQLRNPEDRRIAKLLMNKFFTHIADADVAWKLGMLNAAHHFPTDVIFARDFTVSYLQSHNVILLGSRRANPWLQLFEDRLNFRSGYREPPPLSFFENHSPLPGELATYEGSSWEREGYCRVAFLPNLSHRGNVLVISGTNLASTDAGGEFISSERWVRALSSTLGLQKESGFPYFEVLLKVELLQSAAPEFNIVAFRTRN
ncbi:MAG TPA: hypothetical protein VJN43_10270 [Bryobacteraceae bacterium]|nr:hypothetical protein [Bryobacteraceae bacterium]